MGGFYTLAQSHGGNGLCCVVSKEVFYVCVGKNELYHISGVKTSVIWPLEK